MCMKAVRNSSVVESLRQYAAAGIATALFVWGVYVYAMVRYGTTGLSPLNKSLATSTLFLLGFVLLLGPLSRVFNLFDRLLKYRKELGIFAFFTGVAHVYLAMFPLARRGPWGFYQSRPESAYPGLAALVIMFLLLVISWQFAERMIGPKLWWKIQNWGARLAFVLIAFHMAVLKYTEWGKWLATRGADATAGAAWLPPLSLLGIVFTTFVLVVRVSESLVPKAARTITQLAFFLYFGVTLWLFV